MRRYLPGLAFVATKRLLRAGVVAVVVATFFGIRFLARLMGVRPGLGLLVATGYSICGASAVAAMEPLASWMVDAAAALGASVVVS